MKVHKFEIHGCNIIKEGKCNWPDYLNITMDSYHAWNIVNSILSQLQDKEEVIVYSTVGKLNYDIKEE